MSEQWYCLECGPQDNTHHWDLVNRQFCNDCDGPVYSEVPPFVTAMQARISELEAIIDAAPHQKSCRKLDPYYKASSNICDCWKSKIGSK